MSPRKRKTLEPVAVQVAEQATADFAQPGTDAGAEMEVRATRAGWGGPCWDEDAAASGGVEPGEGQLLYGLVRAMKPAVVLEIGTSFGWSALHLAAGLRDNGRGVLHTVEIHQGRREAAQANVAAAELSEWVRFHETAPALDAVDFAFVDAMHTAEDVRGYLALIPPNARGLVMVHDACWEDHTARAIEGTHWKALYLPQTSYEGLALLQWVKA